MQAEWPRAIEELTAFPHIEEAAVLSTCNRMEIYLVTISDTRVSLCTSQQCCQGGQKHPASDINALVMVVEGSWPAQGAMEAKKWMMASSGIDMATLEDCMFMYKDRDAVNHLMR